MSKKANKTEFYLGNPNLPAADAQIAYEPWMIKEMKKCKDNILHFAENFFYIINLDRGRETIDLHSCQKRVLRKMRDNRFFILLASRQIGKSTMMTIYILWQACFMDDQRILLVANKEATAIEIFQRVRMAFEELPIWLKPGVKEYGKTSMTLDNGSRIGITTTTGTAARGQSVNCVDSSTIITLKDKEMGREFDCTMKDLEILLQGGEIIPIFIEGELINNDTLE